MFVDDLELKEWGRIGLPSDTKNRESGLMLLKNLRWPFIIDPEGQALRWIKVTPIPCYQKFIFS